MDLDEQYPIARFSFYAFGRVQLLDSVAIDALKELDQAFSDDQTIVFEHLTKAEKLSWLWTLGAFEVVRTICQASKCFSPRANADFASLKVELAAVRVPMAKMERHRKNRPVPSSRSPAQIDVAQRDLLIGDPDNAKSFRALTQRFSASFSQLQPEDVLSPHEHAFEA